jgi:hypothetical protein
MPNFSLPALKYNETNRVEEYCWMMTYAAGSHAAGYQILVSWSLDFKWTHLYMHKQLTIHILNSGMHVIQLVLYHLEYKYCISMEMSVLKVTVLQHSTCQNKKVVQYQQYLCNECLVLMILKCYLCYTYYANSTLFILILHRLAMVKAHSLTTAALWGKSFITWKNMTFPDVTTFSHFQYTIFDSLVMHS